jgi:hypothetical protein
VKGLGIAAGAKRPGAKKSATPSQVTAAGQPQPEPDGEATAKPKPAQADSRGNGDDGASTPPVKGLGIAKGARPPGKR